MLRRGRADGVHVGDPAVGGLHDAERDEARGGTHLIGEGVQWHGADRELTTGEEGEEHGGELLHRAQHLRARWKRGRDDADQRRGLRADRDRGGVDPDQPGERLPAGGDVHVVVV